MHYQRNPIYAKTLAREGAGRVKIRELAMKKIAAIAAVVMALSTSFAFAQANPNQGATTGTQSNEQQRQGSQPGNPNNPGPR
jgi:hypothetical protein